MCVVKEDIKEKFSIEYTVLLTHFGVVYKLGSTHILDFSLKEHTEMNSHLGKSKYAPLKRSSNQNIFISFFAF